MELSLSRVDTVGRSALRRHSSLFADKSETGPRVWRISTPVFGFILLGVQLFVFFGSPPTSPAAAAITALASYVLFATISYWLECKSKMSGEL